MGKSSKMWNFKGMNCVLQKVLILKFFCGNPLYMDLKDYNTTLLNSYTIGEGVGHSKKVYVHRLRIFNDVELVILA